MIVDANTGTFCPDCCCYIAPDVFVEHREREHPPTLRVITIPDALHAGERMGWSEE